MRRILMWIGVVLLSIAAGFGADHAILHAAGAAAPQRLAAAMGGLFCGGLVFVVLLLLALTRA